MAVPPERRDPTMANGGLAYTALPIKVGPFDALDHRQSRVRVSPRVLPA